MTTSLAQAYRDRVADDPMRRRPVRPPLPRHLLERPVAGAAARRRAREAGIERAAMAGALLLALTVSGFACYLIAGQARPYAIQAVLPAQMRTFAWQRKPGAPAPAPDLDPTTTGSIAQRGAVRAGPSIESGYTLIQVSGGIADLQGPGGLVQVASGAELPGAGRVLAIRKTARGWVVITTQSLIGPASL